MKVFNNPHFHSKGSSSSKPSSLQSSKVGGSKVLGSPGGQEPDINEMLQTLNPTQVVAQEEETKFNLMAEMHTLKTKVLGLLKKYQVLLQNENGKQLRMKIKQDVQEIQMEYDDIVAQYQIDESKLEIENNIPTVEKEKELNTIFNLVEEFLERFSHHKATLNYFSILQQEKMHRNGLGVFSVDQDGRQSMYDFQEHLPDLTDSNNSENTAEFQEAKIALSNSQKLRSQIRRRFFDIAVTIKEKLPSDHPGRQMLVSIMFEDAEEEGIDQNEWEPWIVSAITQSVFQFTIVEFTQSVKKERVPIQKNILRKISSYAEQECQQLPKQLISKVHLKIVEDMSLLVFALCHISKPMMEFLDKHFIEYAEELQITIQEINLQLFQPKIVDLITQYIAVSMSITDHTLYHTLLQISQPLICNLSYEICDQVCLILDECRGYIENLIAKQREKTIPQILLNKYIILALFQELSQNCYQTIQDLLEFTVFHYAEPDVVDKFMQYSIENFDTLILKNKPLSATVAATRKESVTQVIDCLHQCILNNKKSLSVFKIEHRESESKQLLQKRVPISGLYVEGEDPQTKFIIYMVDGEYKVVYAPLISKRWAFQKTFVIDQQEKEGFFKKDSNRKAGWGVYPVKFKSIKDLGVSNWVNEQLAMMMLNCQEATECSQMDTLFGSFLANVSRNKEFLKNFGESAVSNGCMQQLVAYMPLLKDFLNLGGFGEQALIASQEIYTPQRSFTSTLAISTSLVSGAIIGQALIPIPLVGGIVGGLIGGYLGNRSMTNYTKSRNEKKAQEMVQKLISNQLSDGHWECNKINLEIMLINFKILNDHMPKVLSEDADRQTKWMNLIVFALLSLFFISNEETGEWQECLEGLQKYISIEKINMMDTLDNLKQIVEVIVKNL